MASPQEPTRDLSAPHREPPVTTTDGTPGPDSTTDHAPTAAATTGDVPVVPGYEVRGELARGGMGRVLAARDLTLDREVAIKVLLPGRSSGQAAARFVTEAKVTAQLPHPGIPPVYALGTLPAGSVEQGSTTQAGSPFLAMKLIQGRTLAELLAENSPGSHPGLARFVRVFEQIAETIGYAHARGFIHRDIKPGNVMVGEFGEVQVMDWGLAKELASRASHGTGEADPCHDWHGSPAETLAGSVLGTPSYMAPEQARGERVGTRADVFALGGVLCVILTGKPPFVGHNSVEIVKRAAAGDLAAALTRLDGCGADAELIALAKRCLAPNAADRPADGKEVAEAVAAYRAGVEERLRTAERQRAAAEAESREQRKRRKVQLALAVAVGLMLVGGGAFAWWKRDREANEQSRLRVVEARQTQNGEDIAALLDEVELQLRAEDADRAAVPLEQAEQRALDGGADHLVGRIARCRKDLDMLRELDRIEDARYTGDETPSFTSLPRHARWPEAFEKYGIVPGVTPPDEAARLLNASAIRVPLLNALERWFALSLLRKNARDLRAILAAADPDPFREEYRTAFAQLPENAFGFGAQATAFLGRVLELFKRPEWRHQPAHFVAVACRNPFLAPEVREGMLRNALTEHPTDVRVLMELAQFASQQVTENPKLRQTRPSLVAETIGWYRLVVALRPGYAVAWTNLAAAQVLAGDMDGALSSLRTADSLDPNSGPVHHGFADVLHKKGDHTQALIHQKRALELEPGRPEVLNGMGLRLYEKGEYAAAVDHFRRALELNPRNPDAHLNLGAALLKQSDTEGAIACFRRALELEPGHADARELLVELLNKKHALLATQRDVQGVVAVTREVATLAPEKPENHNRLGVALVAAGDAAGACVSFREAVRLGPNDVQHHVNLAAALNAAGDHDAAHTASEQALRLVKGNSPAALLQLATAQQGKGELLLAVANFSVVVARYPKVEVAREKLAAACRAYVESDPNNPQVHRTVGEVWRNVGDVAASAAEYRVALQLDPLDRNVYIELGIMLRNRGDDEGAVAAFREMTRRLPRDPWGFANLGNVLLRQGEHGASVAAYREAIRIDPKVAVFHWELAYVYRAARDADAATKCYQTAADLDPKQFGHVLKELPLKPFPALAPPPREVMR